MVKTAGRRRSEAIPIGDTADLIQTTVAKPLNCTASDLPGWIGFVARPTECAADRWPGVETAGKRRGGSPWESELVEPVVRELRSLLRKEPMPGVEAEPAFALEQGGSL